MSRWRELHGVSNASQTNPVCQTGITSPQGPDKLVHLLDENWRPMCGELQSFGSRLGTLNDVTCPDCQSAYVARLFRDEDKTDIDF